MLKYSGGLLSPNGQSWHVGSVELESLMGLLRQPQCSDYGPSKMKFNCYRVTSMFQALFLMMVLKGF